MNRKDQRPSVTVQRRRMTRRGENVVAATVLALSLGAAALVGIKSDSNTESVRQKTKVEAIKNSKSVMENIIVLASGANVHSTPIGASDANNRSDTVQAGQEWVIHTPLVTSQPDTYSILESGWIAFTPPQTKKSNSLEGRADVTVYANLQALENQGKAQVYSYPAQPTGVPTQSGAERILDASVNSDGSIQISENVANPNLTDAAKVFIDPLAATSYADTAGNYVTQLQQPSAVTSTGQQMAVTIK